MPVCCVHTLRGIHTLCGQEQQWHPWDTALTRPVTTPGNRWEVLVSLDPVLAGAVYSREEAELTLKPGHSWFWLKLGIVLMETWLCMLLPNISLRILSSSQCGLKSKLPCPLSVLRLPGYGFLEGTGKCLIPSLQVTVIVCKCYSFLFKQ